MIMPFKLLRIISYIINEKKRQQVFFVEYSLLKYSRNCKGSDKDGGGDDSEKTSALKKAAQNTLTVSTIGKSTENLSTANTATFNNELTDGRWCIGNMIAFKTDGTVAMAHSVVAKAYTVQA